MKIKAFGCSFIYGTDLEDTNPNNPSPAYHSKRTWPAMISKMLTVDYECYAYPGIGNLRILESLLKHSDSNDIYLVNWSWIDRFDYIKVDCDPEEWVTLRPAEHGEANTTFYYRHLHSQYADILKNLIYIKTAIDYLTTNNRRFVMTAMDYSLFEKIDRNWHDPRAVEVLQDAVKPYINSFNGKNFLDWSRENRYPISNTWHPLEAAHAAAADYMMPAIESILRKV